MTARQIPQPDQTHEMSFLAENLSNAPQVLRKSVWGYIVFVFRYI